jgi:hypothetical protein
MAEEDEDQAYNNLPHQMMANAIKKIVSKKKRRFKDEQFDLDLTCILNLQIISIFPYFMYLASVPFDTHPIMPVQNAVA